MSYDGATIGSGPGYVAGKFSTGLDLPQTVVNIVNVLDFLSSSPGAAGNITTGTLEWWIKRSAAPGSLALFAGMTNWFWIGANGDGTLHVDYGGGSGGDKEINTSTQICDNAWHHIALVFNAGAGSLYCDGTRVGTNVATTVGAKPSPVEVTLGGFSGGFPWNGLMDEMRVSDVARYSGTTYTVPTAAFANSAANTHALYHFENDLVDSTGLGGSPTVPDQVTGLGATPGSGQVALSWTAPGDGGSAITDYTVEYRQTLVGGSWTAFSHSASTATARTVTGLTNGTGYDFRVSAVNTVGTGTPSSTVTGTPTASPTAPGQVTGLSATPGNAQVALSWTAPASNGGSAITDYTVEYRQTLVGGSWTAFSHSASTATSRTVTGLTNSTGYDFRVSAVNAIGTGTPSSTATGTPTAAIQIPADASGLYYSPYNWHVTNARALSSYPGAYMRTLIVGTPTAITLNFDVSALVGGTPEIHYRVDNYAWQRVPVAATVDLTIPSGPWTKHVVEFVFAATNVDHERWAGTEAAVRFRGITTTPNTCTAQSITPRSKKVLIYGDSITEGVRTLNAADPPANNDAMQSWAYALGEELGAEVGIVGVGGQGVLRAGAGSTPDWPAAWDKLYSGANRSFASPPDLIVILQGQNDDLILGDSTPDYITTLNGLLAACPDAQIACLVPFSGVRATETQDAAAGSNDPSRTTYVSTSGFLSAGDTGDGGLHPYGYRNRQIAALVAAQVRGLMGEGGGVGTGATWLKQAGGSLKAIALAA